MDTQMKGAAGRKSENNKICGKYCVFEMWALDTESRGVLKQQDEEG